MEKLPSVLEEVARWIAKYHDYTKGNLTISNSRFLVLITGEIKQLNDATVGEPFEYVWQIDLAESYIVFGKSGELCKSDLLRVLNRACEIVDVELEIIE